MIADPEFSRPVAIDAIGKGATTHAIEANAEERAALAERFDLEAIAGLSARAEIHRDGSAIFANGHIDADVTQNCVVTGELVSSLIAEEFALRFVPEQPAGDEEEEIELSADECETLPYVGGAIDLGEAAAQTMALALDPFPRSGNAPDALREAGVISEEEAGPFGALKGLRDALTSKGDAKS